MPITPPAPAAKNPSLAILHCRFSFRPALSRQPFDCLWPASQGTFGKAFIVEAEKFAKISDQPFSHIHIPIKSIPTAGKKSHPQTMVPCRRPETWAGCCPKVEKDISVIARARKKLHPSPLEGEGLLPVDSRLKTSSPTASLGPQRENGLLGTLDGR